MVQCGTTVGLQTYLSMASINPIFCVVLGDGSRWSVEAEWPDGTVERIEEFKAHSQAADWIGSHSAMWVEEQGRRAKAP
jgi:hypothetical protein